MYEGLPGKCTFPGKARERAAQSVIIEDDRTSEYGVEAAEAPTSAIKRDAQRIQKIELGVKRGVELEFEIRSLMATREKGAASRSDKVTGLHFIAGGMVVTLTGF